ncbi:MAG: response regulator [Hymenobacter sp.]|nr:MAG: response regulator [Hymenobacter sp.]
MKEEEKSCQGITTRLPQVKMLNDQNNHYFKQNKLLVVEANDDRWLLIQQAVHQCLSNVLVVRFVAIDQALVVLSEWQDQEWELPQLILFDLNLPDKVSGWQLLEQLKRMSSPVYHTPVVVFSSSTTRSDVVKSYQLGAAAYINEPLDLPSWVDCFDKLRTYWWETVALPPLVYVF